MSLSMPKEIIQKVLDKFDDGSEIKINKYAGGWRQKDEHSMEGAYRWSFTGDSGGEHLKLSLYKSKDGKFKLIKTETKVIEECLMKNIRTTSEEEL